MISNADSSNQALEVCFQKNVTKGTINENINNKTSKCNGIIGLMKKLSLILPRETLLRTYKSFVRPDLGYSSYADIIYDN